MLGLIPETKNRAIVDVHRPAISEFVSKPVLLFQTAERTRMVVDADDLIPEPLGNVIGDTLAHKHLKARKHDPPPAPIVRDSPYSSV